MQRSALIVFFNGIGNAIMLVPILRLLNSEANSFEYWCAENPFFRARNLLREAGLPHFRGIYPPAWRKFQPGHWPEIRQFMTRHKISHVFHFRNEPPHLELGYRGFKQMFAGATTFVDLHPQLERLCSPKRPITRQLLDILESHEIDCTEYSPQ